MTTSVIIPTKNEITGMKEIVPQVNLEWANEWIVVDGNSGNQTINVLNNFKNKLDLWISENDRGMWDAWNKGFKLS